MAINGHRRTTLTTRAGLSFPQMLGAFTLLLTLAYSATARSADENVSIQFKWKYQFQFAGCFAAVEKGFYKEEGLNVTLKEVNFPYDFGEKVVAGESEYGVSDSSLLLYHLNGEPIVLLKQFFQHSPLVFLSRRDSGIVSPYEMNSIRIAFDPGYFGDAPLTAMFMKTLGKVPDAEIVEFERPYIKDVYQ